VEEGVDIPRRHISHSKGGANSDRHAKDFILLDVFSIAYIFTGSAEKALQDVLRNRSYSDILRDTMIKVRDGCDFNTALRVSGMSKDLMEWFSMVCSTAAGDSQMLLDSWKAQAMRCLVRIEDAISLVIAFSSLLPVVLATVFLIMGYGNSLVAFAAIFITIAAYWLVSAWMKRLVNPLN
jgi:hypothetical protein